ncbi:hypothetical protein RIR_jg8673.t1 [Rhizophagus irregularis DAOM 181602=DAOM 197198]|uniref:Uncharacterized protein n=1 Tax=Rhizophagus irregularis (strain DAOM 181602 / DAOM 197198 / MUCL 43194) TaxID=747089 RepID=U9TEP8_RHIID|nr:hypothetical protein RIR_jg8673.t1 [Rhizophagus irregularis DAOM 181602=DAOM 197198]
MRAPPAIKITSTASNVTCADLHGPNYTRDLTNTFLRPLDLLPKTHFNSKKRTPQLPKTNIPKGLRLQYYPGTAPKVFLMQNSPKQQVIRSQNLTLRSFRKIRQLVNPLLKHLKLIKKDSIKGIFRFRIHFMKKK